MTIELFVVFVILHLSISNHTSTESDPSVRPWSSWVSRWPFADTRTTRDSRYRHVPTHPGPPGHDDPGRRLGQQRVRADARPQRHHRRFRRRQRGERRHGRDPPGEDRLTHPRGCFELRSGPPWSVMTTPVPSQRDRSSSFGSTLLRAHPPPSRGRTPVGTRAGSRRRATDGVPPGPYSTRLRHLACWL